MQIFIHLYSDLLFTSFSDIGCTKNKIINKILGNRGVWTNTLMLMLKHATREIAVPMNEIKYVSLLIICILWASLWDD